MTGVRVCLKELYDTKYDPLSISYTVLSGKSQNVCPVSSGINIITLNKAVSVTHILYQRYKYYELKHDQYITLYQPQNFPFVQMRFWKTNIREMAGRR